MAWANSVTPENDPAAEQNDQQSGSLDRSKTLIEIDPDLRRTQPSTQKSNIRLHFFASSAIPLCCRSVVVDTAARPKEMQPWILIASVVFVLWVASLCKILHAACSSSKDSHLRNGVLFDKKNVLLVTAHPDDESMFFTPTLNYLTSRGHNVHIICLSTGNSDGLGDTRKGELYDACAILQVPLKQVEIIDHMGLQDGFGKMWNHTLVAEIVKEEVISRSIDLVITFDCYGVSGHCNHRDVHFGVRKVWIDLQERNIEAWELVCLHSLLKHAIAYADGLQVSTNILRKYSGPVDIWLSMLFAMPHLNKEALCLLNEHPVRSYRAMAQHASQWVWFRKLFEHDSCGSMYDGPGDNSSMSLSFVMQMRMYPEISHCDIRYSGVLHIDETLPAGGRNHRMYVPFIAAASVYAEWDISLKVALRPQRVMMEISEKENLGSWGWILEYPVGFVGFQYEMYVICLFCCELIWVHDSSSDVEIEWLV
ncbi:putative N-acetylglucosaminyl-phosphatidylinositol de-N-acetylase [Drosera capensis]